MSSPKCPVDHSTQESALDQCPVDKKSGSAWSRLFSTQSQSPSSTSFSSSAKLSTERQTSSIPRISDGNWVYPSEAQFFSAMARKDHNPQAADMRTIVPIHNAVNERAWAEVMKWEAGRGGEACGGAKLVNFQGKPHQHSPKARWNMLLGYAAPFDRHDWTVDRCGTRTRYIIDFYTGRPEGTLPNSLPFYLDVRPALDSWDGVRMRVGRFCDNILNTVGLGTVRSSDATKGQ